MKRRTINILIRGLVFMAIIPFLILLPCCNIQEKEEIKIPRLEDYNTLVLSEDFNGAMPDSSGWTLLESHYWNHGEKEKFLTNSKNIQVKEGKLSIFCRKEISPASGEIEYTSACISNKYIQLPKSGRIDVRAKMVFGMGVMSAITLKPVRDTTKNNMANAIELAVVDGSNTSRVLSTIRYLDNDQKERHMADWNITGEEKDYTRGYHTYSLIREGKNIWFYVDGKMFFHVSEKMLYPNSFPFQEDFSLCFHISVGGIWCGEPDPLITAFPQKMEIDYVEVYENNQPGIKNEDNNFEFPTLQSYNNLVWSDEFEEQEISGKNWTHETGDYWYNNEIQAYTSDSTNSYIEEGMLVINAMHTPDHVNSIRNYTSARLITKDKVKFGFGRIDFRVKVESGTGVWPAAWLLPNDNKYGSWPTSGEIDVLEIFGADSLTQHMTIHFGKDRNDHRTRGGKFFHETGFNDDFHTYALIREKDNMWFYFDEKPCFHVSNELCYPHHYPFNEEFYAILNIAIGGGTAGYPDENTVFPRKMWIDYVRFYKKQ